MKRCTLLRSGLAVAVLFAAGGAAADSSGRWQDDEEVYGKVCGYCHERGVGPVIKGRQLPEEYIRRVVRYGNRAMPAFRPSEISDALLAQVAHRVSSAPVNAAKQVP